MTDLKLEVGEGILLQTTDAGLYNGNDEISIDELYPKANGIRDPLHRKQVILSNEL